MTDTVIFWFRRDLRLSDNAALVEAAKKGNVLPIYILDERQEFHIGGASRWWLHHSLRALEQALDGKLLYFKGDATTILPKVVKATDAKAVFWNTCYEPEFLKSDEALEKALTKDGIETGIFPGTLLWQPGNAVKKDGTPFKVYKPFLKARLAAQPPGEPVAKPRSLKLATAKIPGTVPLDQLELLPKIPWDEGIKAAWTPGEADAQKMLKSFVVSKLKHYASERNYPAHDVLSRLSPYLHYGDLSPRQVWYAIYDNGERQKLDENKDMFISEVCWRDFSYNVLHYFPQTATESYNARLKKIHWQHDAKLLKKWQKGQTGIPIVDAGMRQLWQTGYMHNRVRMITASFLTKNLLVDWRTGADWFLDCLVDADLAVNTMNWQWVAGTGLDAAPFFRVFNPVLQSKKYDAAGEYIKTYVPELKDLPAKYIHSPWEAPEKILKQAGLTLGKEYPEPCVDLQESSQRALDAYHQTAN